MQQHRQKHIVIFTGMYYEKYGAVEHYFLEVAKQLHHKKWQVHLVYNAAFSETQYYKDVSAYAKVSVLSSNTGVIHLFKQVYQRIKSVKPQVVHTHFNPKLVRAVTYLSYLLKVPKRFNTIHGMAQTKRLYTKAWMWSVNQLNTKQFAISNAIQNEQITTFYANPKTISTLRLGLNRSRHSSIDKVERIKAYRLPTDGLLIANVAFHSPIKGIDILLDAIAKLKLKTEEKFYLCQIGGEQQPYSAFLKQKVKDLGIQNQVLWLGLQDDVPNLLQAFDVYVQPSRSEGLGLAILEAFFAELPVVAANVGGIPEIVTDTTGVLFQPENSADLADKLLRLLNAKQERCEKGKAAKAYVMQNYELQTQVEQQINYYIN